MAGSLNKVFLIGRLGGNPDVRSTSTGQDVASFSIATDESYTNKNGEKNEKTEWHKIVAWGQQAEFAANYLHKGSLVYIEGKIETRKWQDKSGTDRYTTEVKADRVLGLDKKSDDVFPRPDEGDDPFRSTGTNGTEQPDKGKSPRGFPTDPIEMDEPPF